MPAYSWVTQPTATCWNGPCRLLLGYWSRLLKPMTADSCPTNRIAKFSWLNYIILSFFFKLQLVRNNISIIDLLHTELGFNYQLFVMISDDYLDRVSIDNVLPCYNWSWSGIILLVTLRYSLEMPLRWFCNRFQLFTLGKCWERRLPNPSPFWNTLLA